GEGQVIHREDHRGRCRDVVADQVVGESACDTPRRVAPGPVFSWTVVLVVLAILATFPPTWGLLQPRMPHGGWPERDRALESSAAGPEENDPMHANAPADPPYGHTAHLPGVPFDEARTRAIEALRNEGFGVLTEIDVKSTLKAKLDRDFRQYVILGACNPQLAHQALEA